MQLCDDAHVEICYDTKHCPMCTLMKDHALEIDKLGTEIADLHAEISDLNEQASNNNS